MKIASNLERSELLDLYNTHVLPKPQRNVFKNVKSIHSVTTTTHNHSTTSQKRLHSPTKSSSSSPEKKSKIEEEKQPHSPKKKFKPITFP